MDGCAGLMLNSGSLRSEKNCCWSDKRIFLLVFLSKCTPISRKLLTYLQKFLKNCAKSILLWYSLLVFLSRCFCSLKGTLLPCIRKHYWQRPSLCPMEQYARWSVSSTQVFNTIRAGVSCLTPWLFTVVESIIITFLTLFILTLFVVHVFIHAP